LLVDKPGMETKEADADPAVPVLHGFLVRIQNIAERGTDEEPRHQSKGFLRGLIVPCIPLKVDMSKIAVFPAFKADLATIVDAKAARRGPVSLLHLEVVNGLDSIILDVQDDHRKPPPLLEILK